MFHNRYIYHLYKTQPLFRTHVERILVTASIKELESIFKNAGCVPIIRKNGKIKCWVHPNGERFYIGKRTNRLKLVEVPNKNNI